MQCLKVKINKIKVIDRELSVIPEKKSIRKIEKLYNYDNDNLFIVIDKEYNLKCNLNHYKFALMNDLNYINCIILDKNEYFDGKYHTVRLNKKGVNKMANLAADKIIQHKQTELEKVAQKDDYICYICGLKTTIRTNGHSNHFDSATQDHINPRARGGTNTKKNLKCCCRYCNNTKADRNLTPDLKELISAQRHLLEKYDVNTFSTFRTKKYAGIRNNFLEQLHYYDTWYNNN